jgi:hypothetical protein
LILGNAQLRMITAGSVDMHTSENGNRWDWKQEPQVRQVILTLR